MPADPPDLKGPGSQLLEAQRGGHGGKSLVLEELSGLEAALPQTLKVLVQVLHGPTVAPDALTLLPGVLQRGRDARHGAGPRGSGS